MNGAAAAPAEEDTFRVRVSLERYFSDERARCYMSVSRARPVRALARRLRRAFALPRPFALLSRGHLLPPAEPLALLQHDDPVEVIPTKFPIVDTRALKDRSPASPAAPSPSPARSPSPPAGRSSPPPAPGEEAEALADMKRRALELLEGYTEPPRRRRRVRRRRAPRAGSPPTVPPDESPAVVRAAAASPRPARLVRALEAGEAPAPVSPEAPAPAAVSPLH